MIGFPPMQGWAAMSGSWQTATRRPEQFLAKRGRAVPEYRVYELDRGGHVDRPAKVIVHPDDEAAIEHAKRLVDGFDIELWQEARLVFKIERKRD